MQLGGKVAIITGAAQGIGRAIALLFAQEGADIVIPDINLKGAESVAEEVRNLGKKAFAAEVDVTNSAVVNDLVKTTIKQFGKIDILINNAGIALLKRFWEYSDSEWDETMRVHVNGCFYFSRAVVPHMIERGQGGKIINISSPSGLRGNISRGPYGAAKGAIATFTKIMAVELARYKINVNAIAPGPILTPMVEKAWEVAKDWLNYIPLKRFGKPEEIAEATLFLSSSKADFVTGHIFAVDGGILAGGVIERD
jgi:NAD(P)-dependent dehydrogenase (short-subunit alcohol dehydrogenase family)